jgi:hypothetical protein
MSIHTATAARPDLRSLDPAIRRARLLAARDYPAGSICRRAIISGQWDGGEVVRRHLGEAQDGR